MDRIDYEDRLVAFIDVLGFSELVQASETDAAARSRIAGLVTADKLFVRFDDTFLLGIDGRGAFFSDTFILSMAPDRVIYLVRSIGQLYRYLLPRGFLCRGAIVAGSLYHRERVIVGPALVKAHQLERSAAIYPRIILDDTAMERWRFDFRDEPESRPPYPHLEALVKRDRDGLWFLDIFNPLWSSEFVPWTDVVSQVELIPDEDVDFLEGARRMIEGGLANYKGNKKIFAKYAWLATELDGHESSPC